MPELPEVETVRRGLEPVLTGRRIVRAEIRRPDLRRPFPEHMAKRLTGARARQLRRRSKYLLADLDTAETLIVHLGMTGRILISGTGRNGPATPGRHDHVVLDIEGGARLTFNDVRRFGVMDLVATDALDDHPLLRFLGPEPLGNAFDEGWLLGRMAGRNTPVKSILLDQRVVAGLGNIYVCEVLCRSAIAPIRKAGRISEKRARTLVPAIREVLHEAIVAGGSSLRDYRRTDGQTGYFQHAFRVYGREGAPCLTAGCGRPIRRIVQSGRSSFYCPHCQR